MASVNGWWKRGDLHSSCAQRANAITIPFDPMNPLLALRGHVAWLGQLGLEGPCGRLCRHCCRQCRRFLRPVFPAGSLADVRPSPTAAGASPPSSLVPKSSKRRSPFASCASGSPFVAQTPWSNCATWPPPYSSLGIWPAARLATPGRVRVPWSGQSAVCGGIRPRTLRRPTCRGAAAPPQLLALLL